MTLPLEPAAAGGFDTARAELDAAVAAAGRPGLQLREIPAPKRLAPASLAVAAEVLRGGDEVASGRFVVLHDPQGQEGWRGQTRVVAFVSAEIDPEMAADAALADAGWSWLLDALATHAAGYTAQGGTVTRTISSRFGQVDESSDTNEVEIRASWTALPGPGGGLGLGDHLLAWCDVLCAAAGLPPAGVTALPTTR